MRIAFLCKRRYTGKDVVSDRFGRLHEIPWQLAQLGHEVCGFCLDYHSRNEQRTDITGRDQPELLQWQSRDLGLLRIPSLLAYPSTVLQSLRAYQADLLIGASDIPHIALTAWLSQRLNLPYVLDLYDNFESFGQARIPGAVYALRRSVVRADLVITVSEPLRQFVQTTYRRQKPSLVMPNAIDKSIFFPSNKQAARQRLQLPQNAKLIGTAGRLSKAKGLEPLYQAWPHIAAAYPDAWLVLAGPIDTNLPLPHERVRYLGNLPHAQVADLFNALDVGVVTVADSAFGRYCFPQKAYEMIACDLPIVATNVGVMSDLLHKQPQLLYAEKHPQALANAVLEQLLQPQRVDVSIRGWSMLVKEVEDAIHYIAPRR